VVRSSNEIVAKRFSTGLSFTNTESFTDIKEGDIVQSEDYFSQPVEKEGVFDMPVEERKDFINKNSDKVKDETVSIEEIIPTQEVLDKSQVKEVETDVPPVLVKWKDKYFVLDGHHRIAAARNNGVENLDVKVIDTETKPVEAAPVDIKQITIF